MNNQEGWEPQQPHAPGDPWARPAGPPDRPSVPEYGQYAPHGTVRWSEEQPARYENAPAQRSGRTRTGGWASGIPGSWGIIGICTAVWMLQWLIRLGTPYDLASILGYAPVLTASEPWRMLTSGFVHAMPQPLHLLLNMYTLYLFGRMLEPLLGTWRFLLLFLVSVIGGSLGVYFLGDPFTLVIGASGGVFGLFGAAFVFMRHFKQDLRAMGVLIAINLAFGFMVGGIAWQAHVGGLITGILLGLALVPTLKKRA